MDHDPSAGVRDYTGGSRSYDGHRGTDFGVPSFRSMDNDLVEIRAAAAGTVIVVVDGHFDRTVADSVESIINTPVCTRGGTSNSVVVEHANGYSTLYLHLKKNSVRVSVGDRVDAGDTLGIVGSSGCSTGPHLHFEVRDGNSRVVDPFASGLWSDAPSYETPFGLLEYYVLPGDHDGTVGQDPPPNRDTVSAGSKVLFAIRVAGLKTGDQIRMAAASGAVMHEFPLVAGADYANSNWFWRTPPLTAPGEWVFNASVNGADLQVNHTVTVE